MLEIPLENEHLLCRAALEAGTEAGEAAHTFLTSWFFSVQVQRLRGCLVASHSLPQLILGKCGKPQKMWLANWLPHFAMPKGILPHFLTL